MEQLSIENSPIKGRLPLLRIKENPTSRHYTVKSIPAYLSNEIITNLQQCSDAIICPHEGKVSNVWANSIRREKFKHISDNPICICGAGKDLTFLYDKLPSEIIEKYPDSPINAEKSKKRSKKIDDKTIVKIPEKLFPKEFTLSTHHGAKPIQFYDETFATKPISHNNHKISLPIMIPNISSNNKTYQSFMEILDKSGLNESFDFQMPTVLHNLLLLVKKEQDLYNLIFHEVIKETTIDCIERGELLSNVRQRFKNMFFKIPENIKDFHDKVVARKILDRRLTEELMRFQNTVSILSKDLSNVKDHEDGINQVYQRAKHQLKNAVDETKTNADLLREYHDLYEQQRCRLEKSVFQLEVERDCWRSAAYEITQLVLNYYGISSGLELIHCESTAISLSEFFVDLLTTTDNQALTIIKSKTAQWCTEAQKFALMLAIREDNLQSFLTKEIDKINRLKEDFEEDYLNEEGQIIKPLNKEETKKILNLLISWEKSMSEVCESFGGQSMLNEEEKIKTMKRLCLEYVDVSVEVFNRHRNETDGSLYHEHTVLLDINKMIDRMMYQFIDQLTGDNGVADGIIALQTYQENWITRLSNCVAELFFRPLPDSEWIRFKLLLDDWISLLNESKNAIGTVKSNTNSTDGISINKKLDIHEIIQSVDNWSHKSSSGIQSENVKLREAIINLKRNMIRWTSQAVLRLAPDFPTNSPEAKRAARIVSLSIKELKENAVVLHENLKKLSSYIHSCSKDIVIRLMQIKIDTLSESPDSDNLKLEDLLKYSQFWIERSNQLLDEIMKIEYESQTKGKIEKEKSTLSKENSFLTMKENENPDFEEDLDIGNLVENLFDNVMNKNENFGNYINDQEERIVDVPILPPAVEGVGVDYNVHSKMLIQNPDEPYFGNKFQNNEIIDLAIDLPNTQEAFQLIKIFEILQNQFRSLTFDTIKVENDCLATEMEVEKSKGYLLSLEKTFENRSKELEMMQNEKKQTLPVPALFSSTNTIDRTISQSTDRSTTPKSISSSKRRAPPHSKKNKK